MISGTNGLLGAADGAFLLKKEKRTATPQRSTCPAEIQQDQRLYLNRNPEKLIWGWNGRKQSFGKLRPNSS